MEGYTGGARDSEKYVFPDLTIVSVTINGSPNMIYNNGIEGKDMWEEAHRFFVKEKNKTEHMNLSKFYTATRRRPPPRPMSQPRLQKVEKKIAASAHPNGLWLAALSLDW